MWVSATFSSQRPVRLVTAVEPGRVAGETELGEPWSLEMDGVVLVTQQVSDDLLYRELVADPQALQATGIERVIRIGDAVTPRMISEAVFEGHRLAREIELPDPMAVRTFDRERRIPDIDPVASS